MLLAAPGGRLRVDQVTTISLAVRSAGRTEDTRERERRKQHKKEETNLNFGRQIKYNNSLCNF